MLCGNQLFLHFFFAKHICVLKMALWNSTCLLAPYTDINYVPKLKSLREARANYHFTELFLQLLVKVYFEVLIN